MRSDGRAADALRPFAIEPGYIGQAFGSALVTAGRTRVVCTANVEPATPKWLEHGGWVTAQYAMLPGATQPRGSRDPGGRGKEIQRLIARSLRAAVDLERLSGKERPLSIVCDCDVIEADGGTRTASITGAFVALRLAVIKLLRTGDLALDPIRSAVAAVSVGLVADQTTGDLVPVLDLSYEEDSRAAVDLNVVALQGGGLVEVQGTAERDTFSRAQLSAMLDLADAGIAELLRVQESAVKRSQA
jgi:ribonuclease PH